MSHVDPSDAYECEQCGTSKQWSCRCWESEAARHRPDLQSYYDAVDRHHAGRRRSR